MRAIIAVVLVLLVSGCAPDPVPDVTYFRLPTPPALPHAAVPLSSLPIEIEAFGAEGIYAEQALIYSITPDASALRAFHYQLWSDPPAHALQQRLIGQLRDTGIVPFVSDRLPASEDALRVHGEILRFDRIKQGENYVVSVSVELRVEQGSGEPLLEQAYGAQIAASDATLNATVVAFGTAVDQIFAKFYGDLTAFAGDTHAP